MSFGRFLTPQKKEKSLKFKDFKDFGRVPSRIRTDDIQNHNLTL